MATSHPEWNRLSRDRVIMDVFSVATNAKWFQIRNFWPSMIEDFFGVTGRKFDRLTEITFADVAPRKTNHSSL